MTTELLRATTPDGHPLLGAVSRPARPSGVGVVFVHGLGSNGFTLFTDDLARALPAAGVTLVRGNLRDAELLRIDERPGREPVRIGGGGHHRFEDSVVDIGQWIDEAALVGCERIVLFGHSLGSLKAANYLLRARDERVAGLVLASTADLIALHEARYPAGERERFALRARALVAAERADELMPPECVMGLLGQPVSAGAYEDRFGDPPAWDVMDLAGRESPHAFRALAAVGVPILALFGTEAETVPRDGIEPAFERLRRAASSAPSFETRVIEGANHFYSGRGGDVADVTLAWINRAGLGA